nr:TerB family tellurite resistance protein [Cyclobacteriaceae bacterium]
MSEVILRALLRLFAVVARQDEVTRQEREQIRIFLKDHLNESRVEEYLALFDTYASESALGEKDEAQHIRTICNEINLSLTRKQKFVIVLDLVRIILADESISSREEELIHSIAESFGISKHDLEAIRTFVILQESSQLDHPELLIIDSREDSSYTQALHIRRKNLKGFIEILY